MVVAFRWRIARENKMNTIENQCVNTLIQKELTLFLLNPANVLCCLRFLTGRKMCDKIKGKKGGFTGVLSCSRGKGKILEKSG